MVVGLGGGRGSGGRSPPATPRGQDPGSILSDFLLSPAKSAKPFHSREDVPSGGAQRMTLDPGTLRNNVLSSTSPKGPFRRNQGSVNFRTRGIGERRLGENPSEKDGGTTFGVKTGEQGSPPTSQPRLGRHGRRRPAWRGTGRVRGTTPFQSVFPVPRGENTEVVGWESFRSRGPHGWESRTST